MNRLTGWQGDCESWEVEFHLPPTTVKIKMNCKNQHHQPAVERSTSELEDQVPGAIRAGQNVVKSDFFLN